MLKNIGKLAVVLLVVQTGVALAADAGSVPEKKRTTLGLYYSPAEAYEQASKEKLLFVDVRTRAEVNFLGMATVADANIPYMDLDQFYAWDEKKANFKLDVNSKFLPEIERRLSEKGLDKSARIIVMCRSGDRSASAANLLAKAGYTNVYSVVDGYEGDVAQEGPNKGQRVVNGWRNNHLPWSYQLSKGKMYVE